jgi:hypothetical protein
MIIPILRYHHKRSLMHALSMRSPLTLGNCRGGKSFFLNLLSRSPGNFHVSSANLPCTTGLDLATRFTTRAALLGDDDDDDVTTAAADPEGA